ncbi:transcription factor grauzone-like [Musca vetustissima]|uniref:transcription factor grauzone-like n=1 Tax=Musca vetustissima TaxID=27455 RepID=UPI002AB607A4|nr:transcription factor grauzone-like [Musca vetustissima]
MADILCRLCANLCIGSGYKNLYDDIEVYEVTTKYFDPMFLNSNYQIGTICLKCWYRMNDFDKFRQTSNVLQKQHMEKEIQSGNYQQVFCPICNSFCNRKVEINDDTLTRKVVIKYFGSVIMNDGLKIRKLCVKCWTRIYNFYKFQEDAYEAQNKFIKNEIEYDAVEISVDSNQHIKQENIYEVKEETETNCLNNYIISTKCEESGEYKQHTIVQHNVIIKEEPELQLYDVHAENASEHNNNIDSSMEDDDSDYDPLKIADDRRKTISELDAIIAKWRPNLECLVCGAMRPTFTLLQKHFYDTHPNVKCHIICCQCKLNSHYYIEEHLRYHEDPNSFKCKICGHVNMTRLRLKRHMDYWHSDKNNKNIAEKANEDQEKLICNECGKSAKTLGALRKHMHRHEAKRKFKCTICDRGFRGRTDLRTHLASHANNTCFICSMQFKNITKLRAHQAEAHTNLKDQNIIKIENEFQ